MWLVPVKVLGLELGSLVKADEKSFLGLSISLHQVLTPYSAWQ